MTAMAQTLAGRVDAVAIGASAGGVEAVSALLAALPERLAVPVFVVLHLARTTPSRLAGVFGARCARPVIEADDKQPVEPGTVYVAPPDYHLLVDAGPVLALSVDEPVHYSRPSIDVLFESAAEVYADRLAAIVLTGGNGDGATGLAAAHRAGGVAIVQDPGEALLSQMPRAALERTPEALVCALDGISALLRTLQPAEAA